MSTLRFDMRAPAQGAPTTDLYATAIDMCAWAEGRGAAMASYRHGDDSVASISRAQTVDELRRADGPYRIHTRSEAAQHLSSGRPSPLLRRCGGIPPALAWPHLERAVPAVYGS